MIRQQESKDWRDRERGCSHLDVGRVDGDVFAVLAGMGFDAAIMARGLTGTQSRMVLRLRPDGTAAPSGPIDECRGGHRRSAAVAHQGPDHPGRQRRRAAGGIRLLPDAQPDSGVLEVAILAPRHLGHSAAMALAILLRRPKVPTLQMMRDPGSPCTAPARSPRMDGDVIEPGGCSTSLSNRQPSGCVSRSPRGGRSRQGHVSRTSRPG